MTLRHPSRPTPRTPVSFLLLLALLAPRALRAQEPEPPPVMGVEDEEPVPAVPDATRMFSLDRVVIVYPASPGEDAARNRDSAERRARYLEKVRGVSARVVADDRFGEAEKQENLVLLGWNNRVLQAPGLARPFTRRTSGFTFLDLDHPDPRSDLLFYSYSPFRGDKFLYFWSRIDPEMDRFQKFPWVGSNWAIYDGFLVVRQGMFRRKAGWLPERNPDAESDKFELLSEIETQRSIHRSEHYDIYFLPEEISEEDLRAVVQAREAALAKASAALGTPKDGFRIRLFLYRNEAEKEERTGIKDPANSIPQRRELYMVVRLAKNSAAHEEVHLIARENLGPCFLTSLYEGLALSEDRTYAGIDLELYGAAFLEAGTLPSLDLLLQEHTALSLPENTLFPASGLLCGWIRSQGPEALKPAYTVTGEGVGALAKLLRKKPDALESSFRNWIGTRAKTHAAEVAFLKEQRQAQAQHLAGDYNGVASALERALKIKPDDAQTLFNLASAQMRTGEYDKAEKNLTRILGLSLPKKESYLGIFTHFQLGRLYDIQGRREDAIAEYKKVLELPDEKDAHRAAREALEKPVTVDQLD